MIKNYTGQYKEQIIEFHERIMRETGAFIPGSWNDDLKNIEDVYIRPGGCFIFIEKNNKIAAMGAIRMIGQNEAEIKRMRVETKLQRQGFGQKILDHLILHAKEHEIERIILDTSEKQEAAQQFYLKNGFHEYGRKKWNDIIIILYEKYLTSKIEYD